MVEVTLDKKHLDRAPPPIQSVALMSLVAVICLMSLPSPSSMDEMLDAFSKTSFDWVSVKTLAAVRLTFAAICVGTTLRVIVFETYELLPNYRPKSKLLAAPIKLSGLGTQAFFTKWSWNMLTVSFILSGSIAFLVATDRSEVVKSNPWLVRSALLTFEIAAPTEMLVAAVVKYAIWPRLLKANRSTLHLQKFATSMMHNGCVFMILIEVGLLGKIPILLSHIAVAPLFGIAYVFFSWLMSNRWLPPKNGPQFLYFFLDTTLGRETTIALIVLLVVLLSFYTLFWIAEDLLSHIPHAFGRLVAIGAVSSVVCRFHD